MSTFDVGREVDPLNYDLSTTRAADPKAREILKDAKGTVPEPSQDALETFQERMRKAVVEQGVGEIAALGENAPPEKLIEVMGKLPEGAMKAVMDTNLDAVAELCGGAPTKEQITALPARERLRFIGWLTGSLVRPTQPTSDSTPSLVGANGAGPPA